MTGEPVTPFGQALLDLEGRLRSVAPLEIDPEHRALVVFCHLASTPYLAPLDDELFEMLLAWSGFDLHREDHLQAALTVTALALGADPLNSGDLVCGHDEPSALCAMSDDADLTADIASAEGQAAEGIYDICFVRRELRRLTYESAA